MATLTSTPTVEPTNPDVPKPSLQVSFYPPTLSCFSALISPKFLSMVFQGNPTLCVTTNARCSCICAPLTEPAISPVTRVHRTTTSWMVSACSVKSLSQLPVRCLVSDTSNKNDRRRSEMSGLPAVFVRNLSP